MSESNVRSTSASRRETSIPRLPLLWMAAALLFTLPPFFDSLAIWVPSLFLLSLALKFWMEPRGYRLRSIVLKLLLVGMALTAVFSSYGSVRGVEADISLLVILMSLKILEAHTAREFRVMVLIGWMLCLCGFFLSQDFATALCLLIAFALLVVALSSSIVEQHRIRSDLLLVRCANSSFRHCHLWCSSFSCFPESIPDSGLNCVPSARRTPGFPIGFPLEALPLLQILRRSPFGRKFPGAVLDRLVRCIGAGWSCGVATVWNGKHRTRPARSLRLPRSTSLAVAALFHPPTVRKFSSASRYRRMGHAGCLRSTARSKLFPGLCSRGAIICTALSQFGNPGDTISDLQN